MSEHTDETIALPELTQDQIMRIIVDVIRHHGAPMTQEEAIAAATVIEDDWYAMHMAQAYWRAWDLGLLSFGVHDGEMVLYPKPEQ